VAFVFARLDRGHTIAADHELHGHVEPVGDDRGRPAGQEGGGARSGAQAVGEASLAPGSKVITEYFHRTVLTPYLEALRFATVGYGCTTCIGNSGPLPESISRAIAKGALVVCSVPSGNRSFEARMHPDVKANYLASPPLVVAYPIAGRIDIDLTTEPLGQDRQGRDVFLRDLWPSAAEVAELIRQGVHDDGLRRTYADVFTSDEHWAPGARGQGHDQSHLARSFEHLLAIRNDVGLLSQEYDPVSRRFLGNFTHAFTQVGLINTARNLTRGGGPAEHRQEMQ
jgi:hypothetical protein